LSEFSFSFPPGPGNVPADLEANRECGGEGKEEEVKDEVKFW
jgi:hypothetical protein